MANILIKIKENCNVPQISLQNGTIVTSKDFIEVDNSTKEIQEILTQYSNCLIQGVKSVKKVTPKKVVKKVEPVKVVEESIEKPKKKVKKLFKKKSKKVKA